MGSSVVNKVASIHFWISFQDGENGKACVEMMVVDAEVELL